MSDWARVSAILERGLDLPPAERQRFFETEAAGNPSLLIELRALSESFERAEAAAFIEEPLAAAQPDLMLNTLRPGQRIGAYEIVEEAGRGGMGVVYRARDTRLGRDAAVKCVAEGASLTQKTRLEREARLAARLSDPAIATVYALEESEGQLFLVTEFVDGENLRDRLARGRIEEPELSRFAADIARGLAAAHRQGIAHGDLKPDNVIVRRDGQIKILDFGLAETRPDTPDEALHPAARLAGTPGYMAPEQLRGAAATPAADVFAFGVLLFEMATGRHPFAGDRGTLLEAALSSRAAFEAPDLPPGIAGIVRRSLSPDPSARYASADGLVEALDAGAGAAPAPSRSLWWFQVHQRIVAGLAIAIPLVAWIVRPEFGRPWGSLVFLLTLAGATVVVMFRLNADFIARERPSELRAHVRHTRARLLIAELALDAVLLLAGVALADRADWAAGLLFGCAVASIISLSVIEPATTRAALRRLSRS
ncbi:MAG: serine/threonine protein kinase [Acidobacteriota bacterium]|nr:serine/threonine protein kinase [Acidobacteriota bacterium]